MPRDYEQWKKDVDTLARACFGIGWLDLCGDEEPLKEAFALSDEPEGFIEWWGEKYQLEFLREPWSV